MLASDRLVGNRERTGEVLVVAKLVKAERLLDVDLGAATILDVRTAEEYGLGTVPGSVNANFDYEDEAFDEAALEVLAGLPKDAPTYVFCHSGPRSEMAAEDLEGMGFVEVYDVEGGYRAYQRALIARETEGDA